MTWLIEDGVEIRDHFGACFCFCFVFSPGERQWWLDHSGCRVKLSREDDSGYFLKEVQTGFADQNGM